MIDRNIYEASSYSLFPYKKVFIHDGVGDGFLEALRERGLHKVKIGSGDLDVFTSGLDFSNGKPPVVLVVFGGAVSERQGKKAPFFSGSGLSKKLSVNFISFSDPSLSLSENISLGWYAGHEKLPDLNKKIAKILDLVSWFFSVKIILAGGSGGGFASLSVGNQMQSRPAALVWGPQTSISDFSPDVVEEYLATAFPRLKKSFGGEGRYEVLDRAEVDHDIQKMNLSAFSHLVYLQNSSDSHVIKHAAPFMSGRVVLEKLNNVFFLDGGRRHILVCGDWGKGHIPPPKDYVVSLLFSLMHINEPTEEEELLEKLTSYSSAKKLYLDDGELENFKLRAVNENSSLSGSFLLDFSNYIYLRFSFYLVVDGVRLETRGYSKDVDFRFESPVLHGWEVVVVGFIKDIFGNVIRRKVKVRG